jgi:hypothetical protein
MTGNDGVIGHAPVVVNKVNIGVTNPTMVDANLNIVRPDWTAIDAGWDNSSIWLVCTIGFGSTHQSHLLSQQLQNARQWINPKKKILIAALGGANKIGT